MTTSFSQPWEAPNVNAMFIDAWRRYGNDVALDDAVDPWSFHILARRVMALSCFIDEAAGNRGGPVLLFMPTGRRFVASILGVLATGRGVLPIDAMPRASLGEKSGPGSGVSQVVLPRLADLATAPSIILTRRPFERLMFEAAKEHGEDYASLPVLYYDEIAHHMDAGHQATIRERLEEAWLAKCASTHGNTTAILSRVDDPDSPALPLVMTPHTKLMKLIASHIAGLTPKPKRFLAMSWLDQLGTWRAGPLAGLALGAPVHFIRRFYAGHVLAAIKDEGVDHLLMTPGQYRELLPLLKSARMPSGIYLMCDPPPDSDLVREYLAVSDSPLRALAL